MEEELGVAGAGERIAGGGDLTESVGVAMRGVGIASGCLIIGSAENMNGGGVLSLGFSTRSSSRRKRKSRPYSWSNFLL